jgi:hypothetical protein
MPPRKLRREDRDEPALPFDVTQDIDASLVDEVLRTGEPSLMQGDFDDVAIALPDEPTRR